MRSLKRGRVGLRDGGWVQRTTLDRSPAPVVSRSLLLRSLSSLLVTAERSVAPDDLSPVPTVCTSLVMGPSVQARSV